ncbi:MAG: hypothetical protein ACLFRE_02290 [Desulfovermiculus sp.]
MDKSLRYIQLCTRAEEVQAQWTPAHGDFFVGKNGQIECWVDAVHGKRRVWKGFGISKQEKKIISLTPYIWLPRLDQLMELAQILGRRFEDVSQEFFTWVKTAYASNNELPSNTFTSLEQLWLAFVMQGRQGKVWNGSSWKRVQGPL